MKSFLKAINLFNYSHMVEPDWRKPLLYFLKTSEKMLDTYVVKDFLNSEDLELLVSKIDDDDKIPRNAENIWIYQKITQTCKEINEKIFHFQISGFDDDLFIGKKTDWIQTLGTATFSTLKLNIILCLEDIKFEMNHGQYNFDAPKSSLILFPSYLWWKTEGKYLITFLSGDHFH